MYWPFVVDAVQGSKPADTNAEVLARKGFRMCIERIEDNESGFHYRHHGTWLMIRSCTRSALVLLAASLAGLEDYVPEDWKSSVTKVLRMLEFWEQDCVDAKLYRGILNQLLLDAGQDTLTTTI